MTTFQSVNIGLGPGPKEYDATTPTTPRPPSIAPSRPISNPANDDSAPATPTRLSFVGIEGQRPLPSSPFTNSFSPQPSSSSSTTTKKSDVGLLTRGDSHQSRQSTDSQDVDMDGSDDGEGNSDGESTDGETGRPSKKKKGQRFFCTDFPPCNLSFTRSEHLARHIRKHTGERPFQCHCSRRFSRLDNLRQHAQTVHVNEEIPGDSLAATGTRFQRQIRTDRVRTPTGRSRASTVSSQGSHGRGHSRNLSTSSIGSTSSTLSRDDSRRRPPPLMMASDPNPRSRLTLDTMRAQASTPPAQYGHSRDSSGGVSTPTSTTFSNGQISPGYGSSLGSPMSNISRNLGLWSNSNHGRRLSVPSGPNPFQSPHGHSYPPPYLSPLVPSGSSNHSNSSSLYGSPTASTYSFSRRDSALAAEAEWKRRTWHPSTHSSYSRPATSGLSYYQNADAPRPAFAPQAVTAASQLHRLPGIETFDQITHRPASPPHRGPSPMQVDSPGRPPPFPGPSEQTTAGPNDRRGHASWDKSLHHNLTRLDIASSTPPKDAGLWSQQTIADMQDAAARPAEAQAYQALHGHSASQAPQALLALQTAPIVHQEPPTNAAENSRLQPITSNKKKRQGWYNGPLTPSYQSVLQQRTSPEDSSSSDGVPTPLFPTAEYHPSIVHSNGYIESNHLGAASGHQVFNNGHVRSPGYPIPSEPGVVTASHHGSSKGNDMSGLEVLVAVATSDEKATAPLNH